MISKTESSNITQREVLGENSVKNENSKDHVLKRIREAKALRRKLLLGKSGLKKDKEKGKDHVSKSLRKTKDVLRMELEKTDGNLESIHRSSELLKKTLSKQKDYVGELGRASSTIGRLERKAKIDWLVNQLGLWFFLIVCAYIFNKRLGILSFVFWFLGYCFWVIKTFLCILWGFIMGGDYLNSSEEKALPNMEL